MAIPITTGSGQASVATELIGTEQYQKIKVVGAETGSTSTLGVNPDRSISVSVIGTVAVTGSIVAAGNQSVSGTTGSSIIGWVPIQPANTSIITRWSDSSIIAVPTGNQSVSGTIQITGNPSSSSIATVHIVDDQITSSMVALVTDTIIHGRTTGGGGGYVEVKVDPSGAMVTTQSSVVAFQGGTQITSVISSAPSSMLTGASIFGQLPAGTAPLGSIAALQGTNPWISTNVGSIITTNIGSVITLPQGSIITVWQSPSIVGTYAEDAGHTTADKGIFTLGVRNDTVASFASANVEYGPIATDSAGRTLTKPFSPEESRVEGYHSVVSTSVTTLVAAAGAGLRNYITDIMIANTGATTTLITFKDGAGSILGYTIAPTAGGSNIIGMATPMRTGANATFDFQPTAASSIIFATVKGFKAP